MILEVL